MYLHRHHLNLPSLLIVSQPAKPENNRTSRASLNRIPLLKRRTCILELLSFLYSAKSLMKLINNYYNYILWRYVTNVTNTRRRPAFALRAHRAECPAPRIEHQRSPLRAATTPKSGQEYKMARHETIEIRSVPVTARMFCGFLDQIVISENP